MSVNEIKEVAVLGAGVMAPQIAYLLLKHGFKVALWDPFIFKAALSYIEKNAEKELQRKRISREQRDIIYKNFSASDGIEIISHANLVIEAVREDENIKREVYLKVSKVVFKDAIIASNTSSFSINKLSGYVVDPGRFLGMHFFNPVETLELMEIVRGDNTSKETIDMVIQLSKELGKKFILVKDRPGFVVNRILIPMINEAANLLDKGVASAEDIDKAMRLGANHPLGPLALGDLIGLDVCLAIMESFVKDGKYEISTMLKKLVAEGHLGRKTKKGFFEY